MNEFRRAHPRRTFVGDVLRRECDSLGQVYERVVVEVEGAPEYAERKIDGRFYGYRHNAERNSLVSPVRAIRNERSPSNWRMT